MCHIGLVLSVILPQHFSSFQWLECHLSCLSLALALKPASSIMYGLATLSCFSFLLMDLVSSLSGLPQALSIRYSMSLIQPKSLNLKKDYYFMYITSWRSWIHWIQLLKWEAVGGSIIAGGLALVCGLIMWITAIPRIRRKIFELFYYTHHLYILFIVFYILHVGVSAFCLILPGVYLFLVDRFLRFLQSRQKIRLVSARLLPSEAVELNFSKSTGK